MGLTVPRRRADILGAKIFTSLPDHRSLHTHLDYQTLRVDQPDLGQGLLLGQSFLTHGHQQQLGDPYGRLKTADSE